MDHEAMELQQLRLVSELGSLLLSLSTDSPGATRRPIASRTTPTTQIRSRTFRVTRSHRVPPPASDPAGLPAPGPQALLDVTVMDVGNHRPPEAMRSQEQEPEFEFGMAPVMAPVIIAPPPSIDRTRHGVPPRASSARGIVPRPPRPPRPPHRPPAPVRRETTPASTTASAGTRPRVVKFRPAYCVWVVLSRLPVDPPPPCDLSTRE